MKIGIDARMMGKGYGIGRYIEQLVFGLQAKAEDTQIVLFVREINDEIIGKNIKQVIANIPWYSWKEQIFLPSIIKKEKVDLMHFPHWNIPFFYRGKFVVTIHDLIMFHFSRAEATTLGPVKFFIKDMAHRLIVKRAVKKAHHIITTSEFTKHDINKTLGIPLSKMTTIYQAPFSKINLDESGSDRVLSKFSIDKPFVMYAGSAYPHKNLEKLIQAWDLFLRKYELDYRLVLVGKKSYFYKRIMDSDLVKKIGDKIIFTGFVSDNELSTLYTQASLYVFPSMYEGFGLPPLEAISNGVPVVSSNSSCLPEVLGQGAVYFDPTSVEQIVDSMYIVLERDDIRRELRLKAREELKKYSIDTMISQTLQVYKNSCG